MKMFEEVDLNRLRGVSMAKLSAGDIDGKPFATFMPMRRKLELRAEEYH
jgi:hypothetical protein